MAVNKNSVNYDYSVYFRMTQSFSRVGSAVTMFHPGAHILAKDDPELASLLADILRQEGL